MDQDTQQSKLQNQTPPIEPVQPTPATHTLPVDPTQPTAVTMVQPTAIPTLPEVVNTPSHKRKSKKILVILVAVILLFTMIGIVTAVIISKRSSVTTVPGSSTNNSSTVSQGTTTKSTSNATISANNEAGIPSPDSFNTGVINEIVAIESKNGKQVKADQITIDSKKMISSNSNTIAEEWNVTIAGTKAVFAVTTTIGTDGTSSFKVVMK